MGSAGVMMSEMDTGSDPDRARLKLAALACAAFGLVLLSIRLGNNDWADVDIRRAVVTLRAYRVGVAFFAGASLAVAGVVIQAVFRNALASPSVLGVTAGASLGGTVTLVVTEVVFSGAAAAAAFGEMLVPAGCMAGAAMALSLVLVLTRRRTSSTSFLLVGFLLSAVFLSMGAFVMSLSQSTWELGRVVVSFTLGTVSGSGPRQLVTIATWCIVGTVAALGWHRSLDMMLTGDEEALTLGVDVRRVRRWGIVWVAFLSAGAVAVGGNVAFVGLVVPHALRSVFGSSHRALIPAAAIGGGIFLVLCDLGARVAPTQSQMPLGVVTGLIGAPMLIALLHRNEALQDV